jgi:transposase
MSHHSEDYKEMAVKHYLEGKDDMRDTCKLFKCKYQSLSRWVNQYNKNGNVNRKTRKNRNLKITPKIETFVKNYVRKYNTTTLWELSRLYICLLFLDLYNKFYKILCWYKYLCLAYNNICYNKYL